RGDDEAQDHLRAGGGPGHDPPALADRARGSGRSVPGARALHEAPHPPRGAAHAAHDRPHLEHRGARALQPARGGVPGRRRERPVGQLETMSRRGIELRHLGAAGWEISDGERVILLDPYLSRLRITGQSGTYTTPPVAGDTRRAFGPDDDLAGDEAAVDAHVTRADFILHSHSHFNHTIDMPYIARKTGAT